MKRIPNGANLASSQRRCSASLQPDRAVAVATNFYVIYLMEFESFLGGGGGKEGKGNKWQSCYSTFQHKLFLASNASDIPLQPLHNPKPPLQFYKQTKNNKREVEKQHKMVKV